LEQGRLDAITFSSGKTVSHTAAMLEAAYGEGWLERLSDLAIVSIGPQTSERCRQLLGRVDAEADPHDLQGLVDACSRALAA
jgi:uroporphyrinogen-III synthase